MSFIIIIIIIIIIIVIINILLLLLLLLLLIHMGRDQGVVLEEAGGGGDALDDRAEAEAEGQAGEARDLRRVRVEQLPAGATERSGGEGGWAGQEGVEQETDGGSKEARRSAAAQRRNGAPGRGSCNHEMEAGGGGSYGTIRREVGRELRWRMLD